MNAQPRYESNLGRKRKRERKLKTSSLSKSCVSGFGGVRWKIGVGLVSPTRGLDIDRIEKVMHAQTNLS